MGVGDGVCHRKSIPGRGCISVAEGVPVCGPNPRKGIHKAVCTAAVHRRWFWSGENTKNSGYDGAPHFLTVDADGYPSGAALLP